MRILLTRDTIHVNRPTHDIVDCASGIQLPTGTTIMRWSLQ